MSILLLFSVTFLSSTLIPSMWVCSFGKDLSVYWSNSSSKTGPTCTCCHFLRLSSVCLLFHFQHCQGQHKYHYCIPQRFLLTAVLARHLLLIILNVFRLLDAIKLTIYTTNYTVRGALLSCRIRSTVFCPLRVNIHTDEERSLYLFNTSLT